MAATADLLVRGVGELVTMADPHGLAILAGGAVAARDGRIVWVGTERDLASNVEVSGDCVVVDTEGAAVLPGFVDGHTHTVFAGERSSECGQRLAGASYTSWLGLRVGISPRLEVALGIVHQPEVLFLDEPSTGLDPQNRAKLWDHIMGLRDRGTTVFLTTHYLEEADVLCDGIVILDHGRVVAKGEPRELKRQVTGDAVVLTCVTRAPPSRHRPRFRVSPTSRKSPPREARWASTSKMWRRSAGVRPSSASREA
jgi:ABC-type sugar transport system ATPase subunit